MEEMLKFEVDFSSTKLRRRWEQFLLTKYKTKENIPETVIQSDWDEFIKGIEQTMKEIVVNKLYSELSNSEKQKLKDKMKIDFEIERDYLVAE
jgi:hypothetical protein